VLKRLVDTVFYSTVKRLPVKQRISLLYLRSFRRLPNLSNPQTFSEKCQALKLSGVDLGPYVNKVAVKDFVRSRVGDKHVIPTLFHGPDLPPRKDRNWQVPFVVKTNHGSGCNVFVRETPDWDTIEERVAEFLSYDFSQASGELYYGTFPREVMVEPFIAQDRELPVDYKIFTFNGEVEFIQVDTDREHAHKRTLYDPAWNPLPFRNSNYPPADHVERPRNLNLMLEVARKLGRGFSFARVDLYSIGDSVLFGEMGFTPDAGLMKFDPPEMNTILGAKWDLGSTVPA
jgi:hypothetical protein